MALHIHTLHLTPINCMVQQRFYGVLGASSDVDSVAAEKGIPCSCEELPPDKYDSSGPEVKDAYSGRSSCAFSEISAAYEVFEGIRKSAKNTMTLLRLFQHGFGRCTGKAA